MIRRLPRWAPMVGWAFAGRIWVRVDARDREGVIAHERVHLFQQWRDGVWRWHLRYVFRPSWRARYEAEAYRVDIARGRATVASAARAISGPLYLWPCGYAEAVALLRE